MLTTLFKWSAYMQVTIINIVSFRVERTFQGWQTITPLFDIFTHSRKATMLQKDEIAKFYDVWLCNLIRQPAAIKTGIYCHCRCGGMMVYNNPDLRLSIYIKTRRQLFTNRLLSGIDMIVKWKNKRSIYRTINKIEMTCKRYEIFEYEKRG